MLLTPKTRLPIFMFGDLWISSLVWRRSDKNEKKNIGGNTAEKLPGNKLKSDHHQAEVPSA